MEAATTNVVGPVRDRSLRQIERAFLPAALEIVETPPSPIGRMGAYCLVAFFSFGILWATLGRVDIVVVSKGKIIPTGHTKIVQPFETGVVRDIRVHDGQKVKAGDVLITLDVTMNQADVGHLKSDLMAARIDIARLTAALKEGVDPEAKFIAPAGATPDQSRLGAQTLLGQVAQYREKLAALSGDEAQRRAERDSLKMTIDKIQSLIPFMQERTQMRKTLFDHQNESKITYLESLQELVSNQKELGVQTSRLKGAEAGVMAAAAKIQETKADYQRGILSDLAEALRKANGLRQDVTKAEQRTDYQVLKAPIDGTVQQLAIHTIGGVVTPAQSLLAIVPSDSKMEIEAMVDNQDIGFVHPGQNAEIKVGAFNFTRYGLRHGQIVSLSQDAVARGADDRFTNGSPQKSAGGEADGQTQEPAYAARVSLDQMQMRVEDKMVNLSPGMAVSVEIKTGTRRIIDYLVSPMLRHAQESLHER